MSEQKLNPMLSYDTEQDKPKLLNDDAVYLCVEFINNPEKEMDENCHFNVDDAFLNYMHESTGKKLVYDEGELRYTQQEIDEFVLNMIKECSEVDEKDLPSVGKIVRNKEGIKDEDCLI
jgi:hypothetical protein